MKLRHRKSAAYARALALLAAVMLSGIFMGSCAVAGKEKGSESLPVMTSIVVEPTKSATLPNLMTKLRAERLIYVGETHTAYADHLLQLEVLRGMAARSEGLAIGVEWFQRPFQPALDDYLAGRIDEAEMLRRTEYYDRWRFDYRLYRPIIQFAKDKGIPIIALNASRELTDEIRRVGINGLPEDQRAELPDSYDFGDKAYEAILRDMFERHQAEDRVFQRFLEVQLTWDESMAQGVADYLEANPAGRILVLAGRGHIAGRSGIPDRVTRRTGQKGAVIATFAPSGQYFNDADYLVLASEQSLPPAGLMRVLLDEREGGVYIQGFTSDSPAEAAGVKKDDRIMSINGEPIEHFADVKIAMLEQQPGDEIALKLQRDRLLGGEQTIDLKIKLAGESAFRHP